MIGDGNLSRKRWLTTTGQEVGLPMRWEHDDDASLTPLSRRCLTLSTLLPTFHPWQPLYLALTIYHNPIRAPVPRGHSFHLLNSVTPVQGRSWAVRDALVPTNGEEDPGDSRHSGDDWRPSSICCPVSPSAPPSPATMCIHSAVMCSLDPSRYRRYFQKDISKCSCLYV